MHPTAIAKRVVYTPPVKPCDLTTYGDGDGHLSSEQIAFILSDREPKWHDRWHVEMEEFIDGFPHTSEAGIFESEEEARGFMAGWNAHRTNVTESLFASKFRSRK
ncbi:hypothetical protein SAMN05192566_1447 [Methylophilus rhizosphaerae]|uniref:Uncharacterized protein n=1 Tax=Methylophilus rhizosphaerae TaxID=492660 RepID=A0A1G9CGN8_9PROT|nr:hypothetical protein SAMN05192566_1447 [Methylophilus rhizosphaerae]